MDFYTYLYRDPSRNNEPIYVGKGRKRRAFDHLTCKGSTPFYNRLKKMKKMGTVPIIEFLIFDVDEKTAMITEIKFIKLFGRKDLGLGSLLNKTDGGDGTSGYRHTLDALRRISEASKICNQNRTLEHRQKLSQAHLGKKASVETRVKMSNSHIGMIFQDEHRKNLSAQYKQRTPLVCPHCQKSSVSNTMKRWHFNNCKNKEVA